jgi:sec-independent protein translocase protein TatC
MPDTPILPNPKEKEMSIWGHLEELRWVAVKMVIGIAIGVIICFIFYDFILDDIILAPAMKTKPPMKLMTTEIFGQLELNLLISIWGGVILSFPFTLIQLWKFVQPGLLEKEVKYVRQISFFTAISFIAGMIFSYFVMLPMTLNFAADFGSANITNMPDIHKYLSIFLMTIIISGLIFELPLIAYFLGRLGILTPPFMRHYRRHTLIGLLVVSALLSPGGNPLLQLILFGPLWILFELSIFATVLARKNKIQSN